MISERVARGFIDIVNKIQFRCNNNIRVQNNDINRVKLFVK